MATDATGTPTPLGIPKYNVSVDAPSGLGFNATMDAIDAIIAANPTKPAGIVSGEAVIWNGTGWARSSVTKLGLDSIAQGGATTNQGLVWNGSSWAPAGVGFAVTNNNSTVNDIVNTAAESSWYPVTIPANTLGTAGAWRIRASGKYKNNSGVGATLTLVINFGATTMYKDVSTSFASNAAYRPVVIDLTIYSTGGTGTQAMEGNFFLGETDATTNGIGGIGVNANSVFIIGGSSSEDSTADKTFDIRVQHSAANANLSMYRGYAYSQRLA